MFNPLKSKRFKKASLYTGVFALSLGATFWIARCVNRPTSNKTLNNNLPIANQTETPGDKLLNSIFNYEAMNFDADIDILMEDNTRLQFNLVGQAQIKDLEDVKLLADMSANLDGVNFNGQFGYFGDTLTFALEDTCYFKLKTDDLMSFVDMVPTYGVTLEIPDSLATLSVDDLTNAIAEIAPEDKKTTPSGDYYYSLSFGQGEEAINVMVLTDLNDFFKGIRVETFYYQGTKFSINAVVDEVGAFTKVNPLLNDTEGKYQDFAPVFTLFDCFYSLTKEKQLGIETNLSLEKKDEATSLYENVLDASILMNMDMEQEVYTIDASIDENGRNHIANFALLEKIFYAKYHNVAVKIDSVTVANLIEYAMQNISSETLNGLMEKVNDSASDLDIGELSSKIKNMLKSINVGSGNFNMTIDLAELGLEDCTPITLGVDFSDSSIDRIYVNRSEIKGFAFSLEITFKDYTAPTVVKDEYQDVEPLLIAVQSVLDLLDDTQFRLEVDALIDNADATKGDVTISGGVQFEVDPERSDENHVNTGYGYGELNIVDPDGYHHNIKADMKSVEEILFSYNDTLNGKFNIQTLKDLFELVKDLVDTKDEHFMELFGELLEKFSNSPLALALAGDYGLLLNYDIISNLQISDTGISFDISFAIFGMDDAKPHIELTYSRTDNPDGTITCLLDSFRINDLTIGDQTISAEIRLREFNASLESTRLDPYQEYLDFSDIKVLLELGINTSRFNYYHFSVVADLTLTAIGLDLKNVEVPIDVKIRNNHGKVQVAAEIEVPIVKMLLSLVTLNGAPDGYTNSSDRHVSFYYTSEDNAFYIHRTENTHKRTGIFSTTSGTYDLSEKLTGQYLLDNILNILLGDVMGFSDTVLSLIDLTSSSSGSEQIEHEKILEDFRYNKTDNYFEFAINVNELASTTVFTSTTLKVYADPATNQLTGVKAATTISVGLKINLKLDLSLLDANTELNESNRLTALESYVEAHIGDTENIQYVNFY